MSSTTIAEKNIVGSLLMDSNAIEQIYGLVEPEMFEDALLGKIFCEYVKGFETHREVNAVNIYQKLESEEYPQEVIANVIKEILDSTVTSATIRSSADVVKNSYKSRRADKILSSVKLSPNNIDEQIDTLNALLEALQNDVAVESQNLREIALQYRDDYFKDTGLKKIYLGFEKLDQAVWLEGGDVIVLGARPSVGKSALATQITSSLGKQGKRVGFFNLEMKNKQMYERFIVAESGIGLTRLKNAKSFLGDEKERFDKANEILMSQDNIVISTGSKRVSDIYRECKHQKYDVLVIDYLQLIIAESSYRGNRYAEVGAISKGIKKIAMDLNIPIILLSQLNRVSMGKETQEPTMSELRESGDIEQDASVIILLWNLDEDRTKKGLKVDKNRQGTLVKEVLKFEGDIMRFVETEEDVKTAQSFNKTADTPFD